MPKLPSVNHIKRSLKVKYRPPVFKALQLFRSSRVHAPDGDTRRGLAEVSTWVFRLQSTLQALDAELRNIDPGEIEQRIAHCERSDDETDDFTRERRHATATHLRRLLEHRRAIAVERNRTEAVVEYAMAFLEEARAGLAVARELPGEDAPDRLPEVLDRLRTHSAAGDARRRTAREMGAIQV
jgi:hypothetical protein